MNRRRVISLETILHFEQKIYIYISYDDTIGRHKILYYCMSKHHCETKKKWQERLEQM